MAIDIILTFWKSILHEFRIEINFEYTHHVTAKNIFLMLSAAN